MKDRRILYIKATRDDPAQRERLAAYLGEHAEPGSSVSVEALGRGTDHLEYLSYGAAALPLILAKVLEAEERAFDAAIIGCFYDPGLHEAREVSRRMPVVAPAESSLHLAALLGNRFSVLVGRRKWIPQMRENVRRYGFAGYLASFRDIGMGVTDFHRDPAETERRLLSAARAAVREDGAEVIILGCTAQLGFYRDLQDSLGLPVIDAAVAALKQAELLTSVQTWGWTTSKQGGYESPPPAELYRWGLGRGGGKEGRSDPELDI